MTSLRWLTGLEHPALRGIVKAMSKAEKEELRYHWRLWARSEQLAPEGDWQCWLICAGRGFGKTRAGAEWVREVARQNPNARIALVAASIPEARSIMVEGESGILSCLPARRRPLFEPSLRRLRFDNGAQAYLYSAAEPESLRGPQHSHASRSSAEGVLHQREHGFARCASAPGSRGGLGRPAQPANGW